MNKEFSVSWTSVAKDDLRLIVDYLSLDNPTKADEVIQLIRVQTQKLQELPARGRIVPELRFCGVLLYRELIVSPWRIIYRIDGENIWVLAVIDSRRNVEDILLERFIGWQLEIWLSFLLGMSQPTVVVALRTMVEKGLLQKEGAGKLVKYKLAYLPTKFRARSKR